VILALKAAVFRGVRKIDITEVPVPKPDPNEALIKVKYCGICGSDVASYKTGTYEEGLIIGHEFSGEIVELGREVSGWSLGDRVVENGVRPCRSCYFCLHNRPSLCDNLQMSGVSYDGGFAEFAKAPSDILYRIPDSVSDEEATLIDPLSDCIHAVRSSALQLGDRVLIIGAGPIGLLTLQCAREAGASEVFVSEVSDRRRNLAERLGATEVYDPTKENLYVRMDEATGGRGPDLVFECAGTPHTLRESVTLVRKGGQVFVISICEEPVEADFMTLVLNELDMRGSYCGYEEYPYGIEYIAKKRVDVRSLISDVISLDQLIEKGFEVLAKPRTEGVKIIAKIS
jgi:(R,R)-butanediol dehydrogenase/meso-butanediol dehydrogenase/diacetyl reductase